MMQELLENIEVITFYVSLLGILLAFCFRGILVWRQKICFDYESRRNVAISVLRDQFVQRFSAHYSEVADERRRKKTEIEEIYRRPEQQDMIRELSATVKTRNQVQQCFHSLDRASFIAFNSLWTSIVLAASSLLNLWLSIPPWLAYLWGLVLGISVVSSIVSVSLMCYLDGRFFRLVNGIIRPEGE